MQLHLLQCQFVEKLLAPTLDPAFITLFQAGRLSPESGFAIYRNNMQGGLKKALMETYPVCQRLVGEHCFQSILSHYIAEYPSQTPNLCDYGVEFPQFLLTIPFIGEVPYLGDVASLEWAIHRVLIGKEEERFDWTVLESVPSEKHQDLIFRRRSNSVLYASPYPIDRIWETNQPDFQGEDSVDLAAGENRLLLWRSGYDLRIDRLPKPEWELLTLLEGGYTLAALPTTALAREQHLDILDLLPRLIRAGYVSGFSV